MYVTSCQTWNRVTTATGTSPNAMVRAGRIVEATKTATLTPINAFMADESGPGPKLMVEAGEP